MKNDVSVGNLFRKYVDSMSEHNIQSCLRLAFYRLEALIAGMTLLYIPILCVHTVL